MKGILGLGVFLLQSKNLLVLWSPQTFSCKCHAACKDGLVLNCTISTIVYYRFASSVLGCFFQLWTFQSPYRPPVPLSSCWRPFGRALSCPASLRTCECPAAAASSYHGHLHFDGSHLMRSPLMPANNYGAAAAGSGPDFALGFGDFSLLLGTIHSFTIKPECILFGYPNLLRASLSAADVLWHPASPMLCIFRLRTHLQ